MADSVGFVVRPVTGELWGELAGFFGPSGAYSNCWCVWWRVRGSEFDEGCRGGGAGNRALLERLTLEGAVPGLLAYPAGGGRGAGGGEGDAAGDGPVGWVSAAPRGEFGRVGRSPKLRPEAGEEFADPGVWAVTCFWIPRGNRRRGIGRALLDGAVEYAFANGADVVEGYPVDTGGAKKAAASLFTGTVSMFERAGFREVLRRSDTRPVMRRERG